MNPPTPSSVPVADAPPLADARWRRLHGLASLALLCLPALVVTTPSNLLPFGLLLLLGSVLGLDHLWRARTLAGPLLRAQAGLMLAVVLLAVLSVWLFDLGLRDVDNRSRFVVMPWTLLWACAFKPRLAMLWWGALAGLFGTLLIAVVQVYGGAPRADAWTNAIVLADVVLVLMVLVVFCRPPRRWPWVLAGMAAGCAVIVLSGSRGVWLALLALLVAMALAIPWGRGRVRLMALAGLLLLLATVALTVPELREQMRLDELRSDVVRIEQGDVDSSAGARLERLQVAYATFIERPWTGVGIGHFDEAMKRLPLCRVPGNTVKRCHLDHAHNDVAEWAATQGLPGLLLMLAVYGLPLGWFIRLHRRTGQNGFRGPAAAGIMVVVAYVLCGMTQSMFAHQITASLYVVLVGVLSGLALVSTVTPRQSAR
ncbi:O-antigen ligase [Stenotrophomonas sp. YIM B06876]|uniref:O-antigen ligase family protein n=1 Tax=Stenotrophomonas sp. YIM B06876 TaxID=3060211 RepID=UPI00273861AE|nr:O-antigen ligase [Stenotrophomonas sp. YIM B06876]